MNCHICKKIIKCRCHEQKNTKIKYKDCFNKNIYNNIYPQAHLDFDNRERHLCCRICVNIFLEKKLDKLKRHYQGH